MHVRRLILTTDFSSESRKVYAIAARIVERSGGKVYLVHFQNYRPPEYSGTTPEEHIHSIFQRMLEESRRTELANVNVGFRRLSRNVGKSLPFFEDQIKADLVVTGIKRRCGNDPLKLNWVGREIAAKSTIPFLVYAGTQSEGHGSIVKRILVPVTSSACVREMMSATRFWAQHDRPEVVFLLIEPGIAKKRPWFRNTVEPNSGVRQSIETEVGRLAAKNLQCRNVQLIHRSGKVCDQVSDVANSMRCDLILMGSGDFKRTQVKPVLQRTGCSVMMLVS